MSRQSKKANKRALRNRQIRDLSAKGEPTGKRHKGPASTTPTHGKAHRPPYDAKDNGRQNEAGKR